VTRGRLQAIHVVRRTPATRRVPGRRKASRLPRRRSPSRGTSRRGSRSDGMRKGLQPSENIPPDDQGVLDPRRRRGTSDALSLTARRREGPGTFAPRGSAHVRTSTLPRPSSARPTVGSRRRLARGVTGSSVLRRPTSRRLAADRETTTKVRRGSLPVFPRKGEGCRTPCASRGARGKRRPTHRHGWQHPKARSRRARGSDARGGARASSLSLQKSSDGVRRRESDVPPFHPIWRPPGDGRLARGTACESTRATGEKTPAPMDKRKLHVTAFKPWARPAQGAGGWRWKASRIVRWAYPSRTLIQHGLGKLGFGRLAMSGPASPGSDRGVRGSVVSEARGRRNAARQPGPPAEADRAS
jgi:hypothetical protein